MSRLVWTEAALSDVRRLHRFLASNSPKAARRAVQVLLEGVGELRRHPEMGRLVGGALPGLREWIVDFGQSAYIALYHFDGEKVVVLAVRHGREAGY